MARVVSALRPRGLVWDDDKRSGQGMERMPDGVVRPYLWHELPGWGRLYTGLIGDYRAGDRWTGYAPRWVRGKLHGYEMPVDLGSWSNRHDLFRRALL